MKYLFFDTNIYLDIVTDRNNKINFDLISKFDLLLEKSEDIRIILPEIVSFEVYKHLDSEIKNIKERIHEQKKSIDKLYWFPHSEIDIEEYKKRAKQPLTELLEDYEKKETDYKDKVYKIIDDIFKNDKTIVIKSDSDLNSEVLKRKIFKKAPLHIDNKESLADALIIETLINLKKYVTLQDDDRIYFVTRNTSDFSSKNDKKELHPEIIEDLKKVDLFNQVLYLNDIKKLIGQELKDEIEEAELAFEFEILLEEEEEKRLEMLELEEENREAGGLTPLSSWSDHLEMEFSESKEYNKIQEIFKNINSITSQLNDDIYYMFEELKDKAIEKNLKIYDEDLFFKISGLYQKLEEEDKCEYETIQDHLEIGENIEFESVEKKKILLEWKNFELSPDNDSTDTILLFIKEDEKVIAKGMIEVYYGYLNFDDDGNADDGCEEYITIELDNIIEKLEKIEKAFRNELDFYNSEYEEIIQNFKEIMNENNDNIEFDYER